MTDAQWSEWIPVYRESDMPRDKGVVGEWEGDDGRISSEIKLWKVRYKSDRRTVIAFRYKKEQPESGTSEPDEEAEIQEHYESLTKQGKSRTADTFLLDAVNLLNERGKQYDQPDGERSMERAVNAMNEITGRDLTEAEGWLLMSLVERVRQYSANGYHKDSAEDAVTYGALERNQ